MKPHLIRRISLCSVFRLPSLGRPGPGRPPRSRPPQATATARGAGRRAGAAVREPQRFLWLGGRRVIAIAVPLGPWCGVSAPALSPPCPVHRYHCPRCPASTLISGVCGSPLHALFFSSRGCEHIHVARGFATLPNGVGLCACRRSIEGWLPVPSVRAELSLLKAPSGVCSLPVLLRLPRCLGLKIQKF